MQRQHDSDALVEQARQCCQQGNLADGIVLLRRALAADPGQARAHVLLGMALAQFGQWCEALASFDAAIACDPDNVGAHGNQGDALVALGRQTEAIASYDRALTLKPQSVENWCNRGAALHDLCRYREAIECYERALALRPAFVEVQLNRAGALARIGRFAEAVAAYDEVLSADPGHTEALGNKAAVLARQKHYDEAMACAERVLALAPEHPRAPGELAACALAICDWKRTKGLRNDLSARLARGTLVVSPFVLLGLSDDPRLLSACARRYVAAEVPAGLLPAPLHRPRAADEKIRVAYVSADFRAHATAYLMARLFELHDRRRFEVIGVSLGVDDGTGMRERLSQSFDRFIDAAERSDRDIAVLLRQCEVDIAVDLKGHTEGARLGIFSHRAAPIQVSYLGYPGTTGAEWLDYVIADETVLPLAHQEFYSERVVHLPDCYQVNDCTRAIASATPSRAALGLPASGFVFCCFNNAWKITEEVFDLWMSLLREVDGSVLWLFEANAPASANLRRAAQARGVAPNRLIFAPFITLPDHLARLRQADLFLDTLPYNAHTTASDALWAGVPVLTAIGNSFAGRVAASLVRAAGLPDMVVDGLAAYAARARELSGDPAQLRSIRSRLAAGRANCPLFDTDRFRQHIEAAYIRMWEIWRAGEPPCSFRVDPVDVGG